MPRKANLLLALEPGGPLHLDTSCTVSDLLAFSDDWGRLITTLHRAQNCWYRQQGEALLKETGITYTRGRYWHFYRPGVTSPKKA